MNEEEKQGYVGSIGARLAEARRRRGKSLKDVETTLRIRSQYLEALEKNEFKQIPGEAYVKAFLRSYASYLGLDQQELVDEYVKLRELAEPRPPLKEPVFTSFPISGRILLLVFAVILAFLAFILFKPLIFQGGRKTAPSQEESVSQPTSQPVETQAEEETMPLFQEEPTLPPLVEESKKVKITVKVVGSNSWLRVLVDGETEFEGILTQGEERTWEGTETVTLRIGRPSSVEVLKNGEAVDLTLVSQGVFEKTFTANE